MRTLQQIHGGPGLAILIHMAVLEDSSHVWTAGWISGPSASSPMWTSSALAGWGKALSSHRLVFLMCVDDDFFKGSLGDSDAW